MTKDNVTGKNKDFYDLGKKIFDRLNPQGAINPKIVEHIEPKQGLDLPLVKLDEFLLMIKGSEDMRGKPVMRTEWPMEENSMSERSKQISDNKNAESSQP